MHRKDFGINGMKCEACKAKGSNFCPVPSCHCVPSHDRETLCRVIPACRVVTEADGAAS